VAFEERDIRKNPAWIDELLGLGSRSTPTTVIEQDGRRDVIIGFDRARLGRLVGIA
jgi:hypothetical protein